MRTIKTVIFGLFCFFVGAFASFIVILKKFVGNRDICEKSIIPYLKRMIQDIVSVALNDNINYRPYPKRVTYYRPYNSLPAAVSTAYFRLSNRHFLTFDDAVVYRAKIYKFTTDNKKIWVEDFLDILDIIYQSSDKYDLENYGWEHETIFNDLKIKGSYGRWYFDLPEPIDLRKCDCE